VGVRSTRSLVKNKKIPESDFVYARLKSGEWIINKEEKKSAKYDKIFIKKSVITKIPEIQNSKDEIIKDYKGIEKAPEIIELEDSQKFKDENNKSIEIETRGERNYNKVYFKVKDVSVGFCLENLQNILIKTNTNYKEEVDYKFFNCKKKNNLLKKTSKLEKDKIKKELFLTYNGLLRVLFLTKNNKTEKFTKWATETLFTIQMGTENQKEKLASSLIGVNPKTIKDVFKTNTSKTPCVYLYLVGNANKLLDNKYGDDELLCKYGCTHSLTGFTS